MSGDIRNAVRMGVLITVGSILASGLFVSAWLQLAPRVGAADIIFMAFLLPALIAPVVSFFVLRDRLRAERFARANYRLAHMDELTGLPNRRAFFDAAAQLQARAGFLGKCFFVGIADVDNFKRVNDQWGHEVGDQVLREMAALLNTHAPEDCIVARLGGEEFALAGIFPSDAAATLAFCHLVALVESHPVPTVDGALAVTISLGYCEGARTSDLSALLSRADKALYAAKRSGKNRAVSYHRPQTPQSTAA